MNATPVLLSQEAYARSERFNSSERRRKPLSLGFQSHPLALATKRRRVASIPVACQDFARLAAGQGTSRLSEHPPWASAPVPLPKDGRGVGNYHASRRPALPFQDSTNHGRALLRAVDP